MLSCARRKRHRPWFRLGVCEGAGFCHDGSGLLDPPQPAVASLPAGYHWSPNEGKTALYRGMAVQQPIVDVSISTPLTLVLYYLN